MHAQAIPRLCYGAEDKDAGMYTLGGQSKTVKEAVNRMQIFQQIQDLKRRIKRLVRALQERPLVQPNLPRSTSSPGPLSPLACYKCREVGHTVGIAPVIRGPRRMESLGGSPPME